MAVKHNCPTCRFEHSRTCHRLPPIPVQVINKDPYGKERYELESHQPTVWDSDWCGEYKHDKVKFAALVLTAP